MKHIKHKENILDLEILNGVENDLLDFISETPQLTRLSCIDCDISTAGADLIGERCKNVKELVIEGYHHSIGVMFKHVKQLTALTLFGGETGDSCKN